jgi:hypothetical protein
MSGKKQSDATDKAGRKKRSELLHRQIDELKQKKTPAPPSGEGEPAVEEAAPAAPSPREFIHRRMRDLAAKPKK